jgi:hypothetical protein
VVQPVPVIRTYYEIMDERSQMLAELAGVLKEVQSDHALVGGLAVGYHSRPRATIDVDMIVPRRKLKLIAAALRRRGYVIKTHQDLVQVFPPGADTEKAEQIADLVSREANPVLRAAFDQVEPANVLGHHVKVVNRGALVALKFHAGISPTRATGDRHQDITDIARVIETSFGPADADVAVHIAERIHKGAGSELLKLIDDLRHGRQVKV